MIYELDIQKAKFDRKERDLKLELSSINDQKPKLKKLVEEQEEEI